MSHCGPADLIDELSTAGRGQLPKRLVPWVRPHVLVIDEVGYLTSNSAAVKMLFQVVNCCYRHKEPALLTTDEPLGR